MVYLGGFLEDIVKVAVQNGWQPHYLAPLLIVTQEALAHLFWNYAYIKFVRYLYWLYFDVYTCKVVHTGLRAMISR